MLEMQNDLYAALAAHGAAVAAVQDMDDVPDGPVYAGAADMEIAALEALAKAPCQGDDFLVLLAYLLKCEIEELANRSSGIRSGHWQFQSEYTSSGGPQRRRPRSLSGRPPSVTSCADLRGGREAA